MAGLKPIAPPPGLRLVGLDIGGSSSRARLWADGFVSDSAGPTASLAAASPAAAAAALADLLGGLGLGPGAGRAARVDAVCAGSAGLSLPGTADFLHAQLAPLTRSGTVVVVPDADLVLPAAGLRRGVAVVAGTGSVAVGSQDGQHVQAGGWGYLLGDEGGGYWIVREAVRVLLARRDRGQPPGALGRDLAAAAGAADLTELHRLFLRTAHQPRAWARHAPAVLGCTDPAVRGLIEQAAAAVAELAGRAAGELARRVTPDGREPAGHEPDGREPAGRERDGAAAGGLPVVLAGGLMRNGAVRQAAAAAVAAALPGATVTVLSQLPVTGAVRLAGLAASPGERQ